MPSARKPANSKPASAPAKKKAVYDDGWRASYADAAHQFALLGATDKQICAALNISTGTLDKWKNRRPEFADALTAGKLMADAMVAKATFHRAIGYEHDDIDIRVVDKEIVQTPIRKYFPPDPTCCIWWLKNRQRDLWRDKVEVGQTDKEGNDVPIDPIEGARRVAFILAQAGVALTKQERSNG